MKKKWNKKNRNDENQKQTEQDDEGERKKLNGRKEQ